MLVGDRAEFVLFYRMAREMDGDDGLRALGDERLDQVYVHVERVRLDIDQHRLDPLVHHLVDGRREGQARRDHFIAFLDSRRDHGDMDRGGTRIHRNGVGLPRVGSEIGLELLGFWSGGKPTGV